MIKKGLSITLGLIVLALSACSSNNANGGTPPTAPGQEAGDHAGGEGTDEGSVDLPAQAPEDQTADPSKPIKLVFATVNPSAQLKASVKKYESLHPNITIELTYTQSEFKDIDSQEANIEKYVTTTNTAMLAGKGPDLLEMDLLPTDNYASRHLLADLKNLMTQDESFDKTDYFANVLDNAEIGGGLYAMPLSFYLDGLIGDADAIGRSGEQIDDKNWTWDDFTAVAKRLAQKGGDTTVLLSTKDYMLGEMVSENYPLYVDEAGRKAKFDSPAFIGMLQRIQSMFDEGVAKQLDRGVGKGAVPTYFREVPVQSLTDYLFAMDSFDGHAKLYAKPHAPELGPGGYFQTNQTVGVNAGSPYKKEAWKFIAFLVSEEAATVHDDNAASGYSISDISFGGFPISRIAYTKQTEQLRKAGTVSTAPNGPADGVTVKADGAMLDRLDGYLTGAVHAVGKPSRIGEIVSEEGEAFFKGQKSAADVAKLIQNKVNLYLNE
ncbi:ABC transporter substrate-binding protein [Paenibacillus glycinis]|uniref:Extracellular solute-binding protein n=1 Tax=Paenibacillus glycinis TaxID=2697035 RepID=A0ABW9XI74_9BACL|nr:extracellular solute-binding protein [Paenibacillus glycinis]NBD22313.1 extracellular solute-binding protein [Paenibacillus glycinis]